MLQCESLQVCNVQRSNWRTGCGGELARAALAGEGAERSETGIVTRHRPTLVFGGSLTRSVLSADDAAGLIAREATRIRFLEVCQAKAKHRPSGWAKHKVKLTER